MLKVLIIDDDDVVIFIQKKMLSNHKIADTPLSFKKAEAALNYLNEQQEADNDFLILLDINMPEMDGWTFLNRVQNTAVQDRVHVIMVTSSIDQKDKTKALEYDIVRDFIEKPISTAHCMKIKTIPELSSYFE